MGKWEGGEEGKEHGGEEAGASTKKGTWEGMWGLGDRNEGTAESRVSRKQSF